MRRMFGVAPGHKGISADYQALEGRTTAIITDDKAGIECILKGYDTHSWTLALMFDQTSTKATYDRFILLKTFGNSKCEKCGAKGEDKKTSSPAEYNSKCENCKCSRKRGEKMCCRFHSAKKFKALRTLGKVVGLACGYGIAEPSEEEKKLFSTLQVSMDRDSFEPTFEPGELTLPYVLKMHKGWHAGHPAVRRAAERDLEFALEHKYIEVPWGDFRKRFFEHGVGRPNQLSNHRSQGGAAYIANRALIELSKYIRNGEPTMWSGMLAQIHDEIVLSAPEHLAQEWAELLERCMAWEWGGMPFTASAQVFDLWSEAK